MVTITIGGTAYSYDATADQLAALDVVRMSEMNQLSLGPDQAADTPPSGRPGYVADAAAYLQFAMTRSGLTGDAVLPAVDKWLRGLVGLPPSSQYLPAPPAPEPPTKVQLTSYAAAKRYAVETGGTSIGGVPMATDRDTQAKLTAAFLLAQVNSATTFDWKSPSGFVTLTATQVAGIAVAVGTFVQSAYAKEKDVSAAIAAGTITTTAQIDAAAWPT